MPLPLFPFFLVSFAYHPSVDWSAQRRRINRDAVLSEEVRSITITATDSHRTITREVLSLPLDYISGFLFGIDANRVKPALKDRLIRYQRECYKVLADAYGRYCPAHPLICS